MLSDILASAAILLYSFPELTSPLRFCLGSRGSENMMSTLFSSPALSPMILKPFLAGMATSASLQDSKPVSPGINLIFNVLSLFSDLSSPLTVKRTDSLLSPNSASISLSPSYFTSMRDAGFSASMASLNVSTPLTEALEASLLRMMMFPVLRDACFDAALKLNLNIECSLSVTATWESLKSQL